MRTLFAALAIASALLAFTCAHESDDLEEVIQFAESIRLPAPELRPERNDADAERAAWLDARNVAAYLGLAPVARLTLSTAVNIVLIGLEDSERFGTDISALRAAPWFKHVEHLVEHLAADGSPEHVGGGETDALDGSAAQVRRARGVGSAVWHNVRLAVVELPREARETLDAAIATYAREVPTGSKTAGARVELAVDVLGVEAVVTAMLAGLGLGSQPSIVIAAPKVPFAQRLVYGYRYGLTEAEALVLDANADVRTLSEAAAAAAAPASTEPGANAREGGRAPFGPRERPVVPIPRASSWALNVSDTLSYERVDSSALLRWRESFFASHMWVIRPVTELPDHPFVRTLAEADRTLLDGVFVLESSPSARVALPRHFGGEFAAVDVLRRMLASPDASVRRDAHYAIASLDSPVEQCAVDLWLAHARWAMVDLSAGPFAWGPSMGGLGLRSERSVPRVPTPQQSAAAAAAAAAAATTAAAAAKNSPDSAPGAVPSVASVRAIDDEPMLRALAEKFCAGNPVESQAAPELCAELGAQLIARAERRSAPVGAALEPQPHAVDILSDATARDGAPSDADAEPASRLFASLAAVVDSALHAFVLPTPPVRPVIAALYKRLVFRIIVLREASVPGELSASWALDLETVKRELGRFKGPQQEFTFSMTSKVLGEVPDLAVAVATALRTYRVPRLGADGSVSSRAVTYLCTETLAQQLRVLHVTEPTGEAAADGLSLSVPIVVLSLDRPAPVLLDRAHRAVVLSDMVMVSSSPHREWESYFSCGAVPKLFAAADAVPPLLAAVYELLGGGFALHERLSRVSRTLEHSWLWSTGATPLGVASSGSSFSQLAIDAYWRNSAASALALTLQLYNEGVSKLAAARTTSENVHMLHDVAPGRSPLVGHAQVLARQIERARARAAADAPAQALGELAHAVVDAVEFRKAASALAGSVESFYCTGQRHVHERAAAPDRMRTYLALGGVNLVLALAFGWAWFGRRGPRAGLAAADKVKVN